MARRVLFNCLGIALLMVMLFQLPQYAMASPRYPAVSDLPVSDNANIFPEQTVFDLNTFHETLKNKTGVKLRVVTVHFLDGMSVSDFGREVFRQWNLGDDDLLLLASAGDEEAVTIAGPALEKRFSKDSQQHLLNAYFLKDFQNEKYDTAFREYIPQLAIFLGKQYGVTVSTAQLFGMPAAAPTPAPTIAPDSGKDSNESGWMEYLPGGSKFFSEWQENEKKAVEQENKSQEEKSSGFSLGNLFILFILFSLIFGSRKRKYRYGGCMGCGPLGWIFAGLGLGEVMKNRRRW